MCDVHACIHHPWCEARANKGEDPTPMRIPMMHGQQNRFFISGSTNGILRLR